MPQWATPIRSPKYGDRQQSESMLNSAPGPFVMAGDFLQLNVNTTVTTATVNLEGRLLTTDGEVSEFLQSMSITGSGDQTAVTVPLSYGWLVGFNVYVASGTVTDGAMLASVEVVRNTGSVKRRVMCLAAAEVTNIRSMGMGAFDTAGGTSTTSAPSIQTTTVANPAAGANFSFTVTAGQVWELQAMNCTLATSGTVTNRTMRMIFDDGTNTIIKVCPLDVQPQSTTKRWNFFNGTSAYLPGDTGNYTCPIPKIMLGAGYRVTSDVGNIQAADQISTIAYSYRLYT